MRAVDQTNSVFEQSSGDSLTATETVSGIRYRGQSKECVRNVSINPAPNDVAYELRERLGLALESAANVLGHGSQSVGDATAIAPYGSRLTKYLIAIDSINELLVIDDYQAASSIWTKVFREFYPELVASEWMPQTNSDFEAETCFLRAPGTIMCLRSMVDFVVNLERTEIPAEMSIHVKGSQVVFELSMPKPSHSLSMTGLQKRREAQIFLDLAKLFADSSKAKFVCFESSDHVYLYLTQRIEYVAALRESNPTDPPLSLVDESNNTVTAFHH